MSGINSAIPLQAGNAPTFGPDFRQIATLADLAQRMQAAQQQQQTLATLRQTFANQGNFAGGMPTAAAINQAGAVSPPAAMELEKFGGAAARQQYLQQTLASKSNQALMKVKEDAIETYQTQLAQGMPEPEARAAAQRVYSQGNQDILSTGEVPASQARLIPPNFDPQSTPQHVAMWKQIQEELRKEQLQPLTVAKTGAEAQTAAAKAAVAGPQAAATLSKTQADAAKAAAEAQNEPSKAFGNPVPLSVQGPDGKPETVWARQDKAVPGVTPTYFRIGGPQAGQLIDPKTILGQQTPSSANYPQYNENALNMLVGQALDGDPSVYRSMWGAPQLRTQITNAIGDAAVARWGKEADGPNLAAVNAAFASQEDALKGVVKMRANVGAYEEGMLKELDLARQYAHAGGLAGSAPVFNRWIQAGRVAIKGDPEVTKLNAAVESLANEFAKVMTSPGATGGAPTSDSARNQAHAIINGAMNIGGFDGALESITRSAHNRVDAITDQVGRTIKDIQGAGGVSQPLAAPPTNPQSAPAPAAAPTPKPPGPLPPAGHVRVYQDGSAWDSTGKMLQPPKAQ
jgi:hypothetical protein